MATIRPVHLTVAIKAENRFYARARKIARSLYSLIGVRYKRHTRTTDMLGVLLYCEWPMIHVRPDPVTFAVEQIISEALTYDLGNQRAT